MIDDSSKTGFSDRARINVNARYEMAYWSRTFGVTEEQLREAVRAMGVMASDVRSYLHKG